MVFHPVWVLVDVVVLVVVVVVVLVLVDVDPVDTVHSPVTHPFAIAGAAGPSEAATTSAATAVARPLIPRRCTDLAP